jgi:membrane protease subunit (stomatin/prohibitin family)
MNWDSWNKWDVDIRGLAKTMEARIVSPASAQERAPANKKKLLVQWINKKLLSIKQELQKYAFCHSHCEFCVVQPKQMHMPKVDCYDLVTF